MAITTLCAVVRAAELTTYIQLVTVHTQITLTCFV